MPGTTILVRDTVPARSAPSDTGVWFTAGITERGPATPTLIQSLSEYVSVFGNRVSYGVLYDAADVFFREGGRKMYISRVLGPTPVYAKVDLNNGAAAATMRVSAKTYGDWANALNAQIVAGGAGGTFVVVITDDVLGELERSPDLADEAAAIAWAAASSHYVTISDLAAAGDPAVVAATSLSGGTDDHASATDANWETAIGLFTKDYGPGQVSYPGRTTDQAHIDLLEHAVAQHRKAILDGPDTASNTTLAASSAAARAANTTNARVGDLYAPWDTVPGITGGTTRTVAPSARVAGNIARNDAKTGNPNLAAAGALGLAQYAIGLSQVPWTDTVRNALDVAGVNVSIVKYGGVRTYGNRSLADTVTDPNWVDAANSRLFQALLWGLDAIAESYVFAQLDGKRHTITKFGRDLDAYLTPFRDELDALHSFIVDVVTPNTAVTIAAGELHAQVSVKVSPHADDVILEISKVPTTEAL